MILQRKVLFARVGWMRFYYGPIPGDERPVGGGKYTLSNVGGEVYNFRNTNDRLYGYFQPPMASNRVNLGRIDRSAAAAKSLSDVLVVLVSRRPEGGQVIVGWYGDAMVFRDVRMSPGKFKHSYFCVSKRKDCVLLPEYNRTFEIPNGAGGFGEANVCYSLDNKGEEKNLDWMSRAIDFIEGYRASDILADPEADAEQESTDAVERALARSSGQGFALNPKEKRALEQRAMQAAKKHFTSEGYAVEDVSAQRPYDLLCTKGTTELHVEVKGTTTSGATIVLTKNEVRHAAVPHHSCALFVLHSMRIERGKAVGGKNAILDPWRLKNEHLVPISYTYQVG